MDEATKARGHEALEGVWAGMRQRPVSQLPRIGLLGTQSTAIVIGHFWMSADASLWQVRCDLMYAWARFAHDTLTS
jgi:hypothetical protein